MCRKNYCSASEKGGTKEAMPPAKQLSFSLQINIRKGASTPCKSARKPYVITYFCKYNILLNNNRAIAENSSFPQWHKQLSEPISLPLRIPPEFSETVLRSCFKKLLEFIKKMNYYLQLNTELLYLHAGIFY